MEQEMTDTAGLDRELIGSIIDREIPRKREVRNVQGLAYATHLSRDTIYRAISAHPKVETRTLARIEAGLGLPTDALITAGAHDLQGLVEIGCSADLVEWVRKEIVKTRPTDGRGAASAV